MFSLRLINATVRLLKQSVVMALITVSTKKTSVMDIHK